MAARGEFDKALEGEPHSAAAWYGKACALDHLVDSGALAAIEAFEQARLLEPSPPELASLLAPLERTADGRRALAEDRLEDALRAFDEALRIHPTSKGGYR